MLKKSLDTPWKRISFVLLVMTVSSMAAALFLPPPFDIRHREEWLDTQSKQDAQRTVHRIAVNCADTALGGKESFVEDFGKIIKRDGRYDVSEEMRWDRMAQERPTNIDLTENDIEVARTMSSIPPGECDRKLSFDCILRPELFEPNAVLRIVMLDQILSTCSTGVPQSFHSSRYIDWNQRQLKKRIPLILSLSGLALLLACLSISYTPTIGRLVSWIRNG